MDPSAAVIVFTTWPAASDPGPMAATLVTERLAACVSMMPAMESVYAWKGELQRNAERQLLIKTTGGRLEELKTRLGELHPYELPEWLVVAVDEGSDAYLGWLRSATDSAHGPRQS